MQQATSNNNKQQLQHKPRLNVAFTLPSTFRAPWARSLESVVQAVLSHFSSWHCEYFRALLYSVESARSSNPYCDGTSVYFVHGFQNFAGNSKGRILKLYLFKIQTYCHSKGVSPSQIRVTKRTSYHSKTLHPGGRPKTTMYDHADIDKIVINLNDPSSDAAEYMVTTFSMAEHQIAIVSVYV